MNKEDWINNRILLVLCDCKLQQGKLAFVYPDKEIVQKIVINKINDFGQPIDNEKVKLKTNAEKTIKSLMKAFNSSHAYVNIGYNTIISLFKK